MPSTNQIRQLQKVEQLAKQTKLLIRETRSRLGSREFISLKTAKVIRLSVWAGAFGLGTTTLFFLKNNPVLSLMGLLLAVGFAIASTLLERVALQRQKQCEALEALLENCRQALAEMKEVHIEIRSMEEPVESVSFEMNSSPQ